jgi:hypothetical protein
MAMSADMKPSNWENIQGTFVVVAGRSVVAGGRQEGLPGRAPEAGVGRVSGRRSLSPGVPRSQGLVDNRLMGCRENVRFSSLRRTLRHRFQACPTLEDGMRILTIGVLLTASLGLAACGRDPGTRAVTGGLIGAGAGAAVGAATGGSPATGALVGGGVGAVGGAVTR